MDDWHMVDRDNDANVLRYNGWLTNGEWRWCDGLRHKVVDRDNAVAVCDGMMD